MIEFKRWCLVTSTWILWLSLTGWLFCTSLWYEAWHLGLIKYACMQTYTPPMRAFMAFVYHPLSGILINLMILAGFLSVSLMVIVVKHRDKSTEKLFNLIGSRNSNPILFAAASVGIACACCYNEPYSSTSAMLCILVGTVLIIVAAAL